MWTSTKNWNCFSEKLTDDLPGRDVIHSLADEQILVGATHVQGGGWLIKLLAADAVSLRKAMATTRSTLYAALQRAQPAFRKH